MEKMKKMKKCYKMYLTHNEEKSDVDGGFIRNLKNKYYKYMTLISKNVYIDKLDGIVNKYNNLCHNTVQTKPVDVKTSRYINSSKEINDDDPKFKNVPSSVNNLKSKVDKLDADKLVTARLDLIRKLFSKK